MLNPRFSPNFLKVRSIPDGIAAENIWLVDSSRVKLSKLAVWTRNPNTRCMNLKDQTNLGAKRLEGTSWKANTPRPPPTEGCVGKYGVLRHSPSN